MLLCSLAGCATRQAAQPEPAAEPPPPLPVMTAAFAATPVVTDGVLDDGVWQQAAAYPLYRSKRDGGRAPREPGEVRIAWDDTHLYVGVRFQDSDIVAEGKTDQIPHFRYGDLLEVFLWPEDFSWYWELYATPAGRKTAYWYPERKSGHQACSAAFTVAARCEGSLGEFHDKDQYWTAEMAVPVTALTSKGETFGPGSRWRLLVSRYNYSRYLPVPWLELASTPRLSRTSFHLRDEYAVLEFEPGAAGR